MSLVRGRLPMQCRSRGPPAAQAHRDRQLSTWRRTSRRETDCLRCKSCGPGGKRETPSQRRQRGHRRSPPLAAFATGRRTGSDPHGSSQLGSSGRFVGRLWRFRSHKHALCKQPLRGAFPSVAPRALAGQFGFDSCRPWVTLRLLFQLGRPTLREEPWFSYVPHQAH